MSDGSWDLQKVVFGLLEMALDVRVYAPAPQNAKLPYVDIAESDATSDDVQCRRGLDETLTIHVWTPLGRPAGSQALAKQIMSTIRDALHAKALEVPGRSSAFAFVTASRLFADDDDAAMHGVVTLRVNHHGPEEG